MTAHRAQLQVLNKEQLDSETHEPYGQGTPPPSSAFSKDSEWLIFFNRIFESRL